MRLSLRIGAILAGASHLDLATLSRFAGLLGDAYQLSDDLLDLDEDSAIFRDEQKTFALNEGRQTANLQLQKITEEAKRNLVENFPPSEARSCLMQFTDYLAERKA